MVRGREVVVAGVDCFWFGLFSWWDWGLISGLHAYEAGMYCLSHASSLLLHFLWRRGLANYLP
jgi:hypothetical protein